MRMSLSGEDRHICVDLDVKDNSGIVAFDETEKRHYWQKKIGPLLPKIIDLEVGDWSEIILFANKGSLLKTPLQKALFLFNMRSGIPIKMFGWQPDNYGPYSREIERVVSESKNIEKQHISGKKGIMYEYRLKENQNAEALWGVLPPEVKELIKEIAEELKKLGSTNKIEEFIHAAYPGFAVNAI